MSDPSLLALVINDPLAPPLLAAWKASKYTLAQADEDAVLWELEDLVQAPSTDALKLSLKRCRRAGLLVDGGISPVADSWLSAHVGRLLGFKSKPPEKPKPTTAKT